MIFSNKKKKKSTSEINMGTLYDMNKNLVESNVPVLTEEELKNKKEIILEYMNKTNDNYYMLLCNEKKDYTVFHRNKNKNGHFWDRCEGSVGNRLENILIDECLPNRGQTKSIEFTEDRNAIEIWISINNESFCYYFFNYGNAVIEC